MLNAQYSMLKKRFGYTLIEILVVITIGVILGTVGMVKYRDASRRQAVDAAAEKLVSALRKAQVNAASGVKNSCGSSPLEGWQVKVNANNYVIQVKCVDSTYDNRTENIEGASVTSFPSSNPILFNLIAALVPPVN